MRSILSRIFAIVLLLGIAQTLTACVVYERPYHSGWHHW